MNATLTAQNMTWGVDTIVNIVVSFGTLLMQFYQSHQQGHFTSTCCGKTIAEIDYDHKATEEEKEKKEIPISVPHVELVSATKPAHHHHAV